MPAAATIGDPTSHGTPLAPSAPPAGSPDVFIGGRPAWRALNGPHACPLTTPAAHTGGVVVGGSSTVYVNGMPAVRQGDKIVEAAGPPNVVIGGRPDVQIGG
ncbi:PAAR domain-containing protein [Sphaerisporangium rhizosphaerae]|uniref:PAAR domain-containing protein n=1 Tax=Sphaerisporangium rhizosphaerae TaxID=2269375 RepID=A0ABW2PJS7_9ACTN